MDDRCVTNLRASMASALTNDSRLIITTMNYTSGYNHSAFVGCPLNPGVRLVLICFGWLACVSGIFGNVLVITTLLSQPALRTLHNLYMGNLAAADLIISAYVIPFWLLDLSHGRHPVLNATHCICNSYITCWAFTTSVLTLVAISLNRYLSVCHHPLFVRIFTKQRTLALCVMTWVLGFFLCLPNRLIIPVHDAGYDRRIRLCAFGRNKTGIYSTWYTFVILLLPSVLVGFSNGAIFCHWRRSRTRIRKWGRSKSPDAVSTHHDTGGSTPHSVLSSPREGSPQPPLSHDGGGDAVPPGRRESDKTSTEQIRVDEAEGGVCEEKLIGASDKTVHVNEDGARINRGEILTCPTGSTPDNDYVSDGTVLLDEQCKLSMGFPVKAIDEDLRKHTERTMFNVSSSTPANLTLIDEAEDSVYGLNDGNPGLRVLVNGAENCPGGNSITFNVLSTKPVCNTQTNRGENSSGQLHDDDDASVRIHATGNPRVYLVRTDRAQEEVCPQNYHGEALTGNHRSDVKRTPASSEGRTFDSDHELCHADKYRESSHSHHSGRELLNQRSGRLLNGAPGLTSNMVDRGVLKGHRFLHPPRTEAVHVKEHIPINLTVADSSSDEGSVNTLCLSRDSLDFSNRLRTMCLSKDSLDATNKHRAMCYSKESLDSSKIISSMNLSKDCLDSGTKTASRRSSSSRRRRKHCRAHPGRNLSSSDISMIRSLLVVFVCCVILYMPLAVVAIVNIYTPKKIPVNVTIWCLAAAFLNHSINWILYGLMNKSFRKGYVRQLSHCCRKYTSKTT